MPRQLEAVERARDPRLVFNITVAVDHNYFVHGVLVHDDKGFPPGREPPR